MPSQPLPPMMQPSMQALPIPASGIPHGVGLPPPPGMDPRKGKLMCIKVRMLDDTTAVFHLGHKAAGQALFDEVCRHLNLLESDYFGLEFIDGYGNKVWLDKEKSILRQITSTQSDARFYFIVKFYTPNPADLEEEYTRYLISLQIRRDLAQGEFVCNENTAALLVAYIVQADCGDFLEEDYPDHTYLSPIAFVPHQTVAFQIKVMENHKQLVGMTPGEADLALLEVARRCDFYGIKLHIARDIEGTDVNLSVAHMGVKVFHHLQCVSVFSWAKIRKLSFKRKKLMIKLHPESNPCYKETVEFNFDTRNECKNFWKKCVEHHAFFRCLEISEPRKEHKLFSRGSSFRYHGRTQKQLIDYVREHHKRREPFSRPLRPTADGSSRSGTLPQKFNVIDATTGTLTRKATPLNDSRQPQLDSGNNGDLNPVYYPPGSAAQKISSASSSRQPRPKSVHQPATQSTSYASDNERNCVSDFEATSTSAYKEFKRSNEASKPSKKYPEPIAEAPISNPTGDPMSVSLPNVLGDDIKIVCREFELKLDHPPKSASGDNFLEQVNDPHAQFDYYLDNMSEGSYKLHDLEHGASSSTSDVGSSATDPRVYATTFTTKRVGNVIVKRIQGPPEPARKPIRQRSEDDDSSSYSEATGTKHSSRAKSAPSSRYAQVMRQSLAAGGMARFRDAVPIPIDGPDAPLQPVVSASSSTVSHANIIRPVVLSPVQGKSANTSTFGPAVSHSDSGPTMKSATIQQIPSIAAAAAASSNNNDEPKYSVVTRVKQPPPLNASTFTAPPPPANSDSFRSIATTKESTERDPSAEKEAPRGIPSTYGATGPVPGKVIHRDNIVITPEGISVRQKPAVPPKPKNIPDIGQSSIKPVPLLTSAESASFDKLLEPLDSILKDAQELSVLSTGKPKPFPAETEVTISVESVDRPDVKKLHLLNGDIPYTLTMRNLQSGATPGQGTSTFGGGMASGGGNDEKKNVDLSKHHKSLDFVHRRRLPSQDSFSSQDHSISPTTPEAGNFVEYASRRRSLSSDRNKKGTAARRADPRRQTQPVSIKLTETTVITTSTSPAVSEALSNIADTAGKVPLAQPESCDTTANATPEDDLPEPPAELASPPPTSSAPALIPDDNPKSTSDDTSTATQRSNAGLLITDF
uniref:Moesin/ezrin/radixin homolog 1 n=1 Tax=Panagrellus redivivus TaxID=6233 RepID=A0A7E4UW05_PANRE